MNAQAVLPLFPASAGFGRSEADAPALRRRAGVEYFDLGVREILNRADSPRLPFDWTINPYRGCEFGCTYCYARYTHGFFETATPEDFETKIFVKRRAAERLRERLKRHDFHGQPIALGTATDPYQPAERHFGITRALLEVFRDTEGLTLSITTKSPLVTRDLDLLTELDRKHALEIQVSITTVDPRLARDLEPAAPDARTRVATVERLAEAGLSVTVNAMPILPGINDSEAVLRPLFEAARAAGAREVGGMPLFLRPASRKVFFPWLTQRFPELVGMYQRLYRDRDYLDTAARDQLLSTYRRLKLEYGFPAARVGRA